MLLTVRIAGFSMEIELEIVRKISRKLYNFYFMLEMYNLMLVSVESVWERFQSPTDSKNDQNLRCISHNPLQQGFQYKWSSAAVHHWGFIIGFLESLHANRPISKSFESCSKPLKPHTVIGILPNFTGDELLGTKTKYSNRVVEMLSFSLDMLQCIRYWDMPL